MTGKKAKVASVTISNKELINKEDTTDKVSSLVANALGPIGAAAVLNWEIHQDETDLQLLKMGTQSPMMINKIEEKQRKYNEKIDKCNKERAKAVDLILHIADTYSQAYSMQLEHTGKLLEEGLCAFADKLSTDAKGELDIKCKSMVCQIEQQEARLTSLTDDTKESLRVMAEKVKTDIVKATQLTKTVRNELESKTEALDKKIDEVKENQAGQTGMEKISQRITDMLKGGIGRLESKTDSLVDEHKQHKETVDSLTAEIGRLKSQLTELKTDSVAVKQQLISQHATDVVNKATEKEITLIKNSVTEQETKLKEIYHIIKSADEINSPNVPETNNHNDNNNNNNSKNYHLKTVQLAAALSRLSDLESHIVYLLTKLDLMEPRHRLEYQELRNMITESKANGSQISTVAVGSKRPRESDDEITTRMAKMEEDVKRMEFKLTSLVEFIHQFRSSVLNPSFPEKLEHGLLQMEDVLKNHEMFISYLMDPMATSAYLKKADTKLVDLDDVVRKQQETPQSVSPAMLDTISKYIENETAEILSKQEMTINKQAKKIIALEQQTERNIALHIEDYMRKFNMQQVEPLKEKIHDLEQRLLQENQRK